MLPTSEPQPYNPQSLPGTDPSLWRGLTVAFTLSVPFWCVVWLLFNTFAR